jgi:hypothetical protein
MQAQVDHLVVAAASLEQGAAWCEATLGVAPGPGGRHSLFGTHNRLLRIDGPGFEQAYLEIIAIDPPAPPPARPRWFGLDEPATAARLAQRPQLWHVVARTGQLDAYLARLRAAGVDAGEALAASRETPSGLLRWRIAVRADGRLLCGGALPTLIEWDGRHPTEAMPASPVRLRALALAGLPPAVPPALGLPGVTFMAQSGAALRATFDTPRGAVTLDSAGRPEEHA